MSRMKAVEALFCLLLFVAITILVPGLSEAKTRLKVATATEGGTYYSIGVELCNFINGKLSSSNGITMKAIPSAGSVENIGLLEENVSQLAMVEGLIAAMAFRGKGRFDGSPKRFIRSITALWDDVVHIVVKAKKAESGNVMDLAAFDKEGFSMGEEGSGTQISTESILKDLNIYPKDVSTVVNLGYHDSFLALKNGSISGMSTPGGVPVDVVTEAFSIIGAKNLRLLEFSDEQIDSVNFPLAIWHPYAIPANTYSGQIKTVNSIAQPNLLAVRQNISEDVIYLLTKTIYENLPTLKKAHKALKAMQLEKAIRGLQAPLHPGALKYYEEQGVEIPSYLLPGSYR